MLHSVRRRAASVTVLAVTVTATVAGVLVCTAAAAVADTGGHVLTYTSAEHGFVATAAHPMARRALPLPHLPHAEDPSIESIVPSPDGQRLAQAFDFFVETPRHLTLLTAVVITDRRGGHQQLVWRQRWNRGFFPTWIDGMSWSADGHRLYVAGPVRHAGQMTTRLFEAHVRAASVGDVSAVPGTLGLVWPATDPTSRAVAAVDPTKTGCVRPDRPVHTWSAALVVLHPRTGERHALTTFTTPAAECGQPIENLAWSPDGDNIAFDTDWTKLRHQRETADIRLVSVHGPDSTQVIVASGKGRHVAAAPAWQNARTLWFQWKPVMDDPYDSTSNLYSTTRTHGAFGPMVERTHVRRYDHRLFGPSFG